MNRNPLPARWRPAAAVLAVGAAALVAGGSSYGWGSAAYLSPVILAAAAAVGVLAGRDSDVGAAARRQRDERQQLQRLRVQALVGRALSLTVALAYAVAVTTRALLWPFGVMLGVLVVAFLAGWVLYGDDPSGATGRLRSLLRR